ncbi:MAG: NADP-dependent oxidoreductase [Rikenellaceae bacterium]|nr:NADP-dependent oxidoreductase [Rikenellaceae bacterium]
MKAVRIHRYGDSDALVYEEAPRPELKEGQVLVEIMATSVNHIDVLMASGKMKDTKPLEFPWIPGVDFAGRIDYMEGETEGFRVGDEVYGKLYQGSYARYAAVDKGTFARMPANLSFAQAASVPHVGLTAWESVFEKGRIEPGQNVLIQGAAGAVGSYAVQFVKLAGGFIFAVASGQDAEYLRSIGADVVIDYKNSDFTTIAKDIDLVLDFVGGDTASRSFPIMKKGGRLISTVAEPDKKESKKYGVEAEYIFAGPQFLDLKEITELIESGKVTTDVADIYPITEVKKAWDIYNHKEKPERTYSHGKIVLELQ